MKRLIALVIVVSGAALLSAKADPRAEWAKSLKGRTATLKIDLPTMLVPEAVGLLVISPDRGDFYTIYEFTDRTPEQLLAKVKADNQKRAGSRAFSFQTGTPAPAELTQVKAGAPVTIMDVKINNGGVLVLLWDEFARTKGTLRQYADPASTSFSISAPTSKDFHERPAIEALMARVLDMKK